MIRARRKELGLTQGQVAAQIRIEEGRPIGQTYLAEIERGHHPNPRPHLIEEFARVLEIDRDVLYLAARQVPPDVAEELRRLTPEGVLFEEPGVRPEILHLRRRMTTEEMKLLGGGES
jgi:transcriptional regulator with XRE-family HTH domain